MKKITFLLLLALASRGSQAQSTRADSLGIRQACEDYVGGFYNGDTSRIMRGVHPELVKRIIAKKMDNKIMNMSATELTKAASSGKRPPDPDPSVPFKVDVAIYDITNGISLAKITTNKMSFFDYVQLARMGDGWKVINVLWAFNK